MLIKCVPCAHTSVVFLCSCVACFYILSHATTFRFTTGVVLVPIEVPAANPARKRSDDVDDR